MNFFRWIFLISLTTGMFWMFGFAYEFIGKEEPSIFKISLLSILLSAILSFSTFKFIPNFLKDNSESHISSGKYYFFGIVASYFLLIPIFAAIAYLVSTLFGNINSNDSVIGITLFAIWFPLWWMVPAGLAFGWSIYKRKCSL